MGKCFRCGKPIRDGFTLCEECARRLNGSVNKGKLVDDMCEFIKENDVPGLIELVLQAIQKVGEE